MDTKVLSVTGDELRTVSLDDGVFARKYSEGSVYHAVRNELANKRVGTASVKTRHEVKGSGKKPWRQKGTGRARAGTRQSPVWVGGGVAFGPQPRDYSYQLPKKVKRAALQSIISKKMSEGSLVVLEDFTVESGKTRDLVTILSSVCDENRTVLVMKDDDEMVKRAARNIPWLRYLSYSRLRAHDLYYSKRVVVMETAAVKMCEMYRSDKV
jgi:large subunit ribosomal protein L4